MNTPDFTVRINPYCRYYMKYTAILHRKYKERRAKKTVLRGFRCSVQQLMEVIQINHRLTGLTLRLGALCVPDALERDSCLCLVCLCVHVHSFHTFIGPRGDTVAGEVHAEKCNIPLLSSGQVY